ncbi:MAG: hypothetical protein JNM76_03635 [Betaproteobacteria bacterium]|nr:hypothetical protein [Betaproteobacteria bacterium]
MALPSGCLAIIVGMDRLVDWSDAPEGLFLALFLALCVVGAAGVALLWPRPTDGSQTSVFTRLVSCVVIGFMLLVAGFWATLRI